MPADVIVCVSTELEGALLKPHLPVLVTGVGAVNAAIALTRFLERDGPHAILSCGIGGAYPGAALQPATAVWAESECYGDLGAASAEGFLDMQALGFPVIAGAAPIYNILPVTLRPRDATARRFVTVNTCTGSDDTAREIETRTGGAVETMEGAAIAHVAALYGIPMGEVRGISNRAGNRDRASWRVKEAAAAAQNALLRSIDTLL
ncbi:MAG TPA: futalosine hydrolase [Bryobacteraceae bacterium]|nr:futalosine hydrolase [Bryobacteraceae bacterium]